MMAMMTMMMTIVIEMVTKTGLLWHGYGREQLLDGQLVPGQKPWRVSFPYRLEKRIRSIRKETKQDHWLFNFSGSGSSDYSGSTSTCAEAYTQVCYLWHNMSLTYQSNVTQVELSWLETLRSATARSSTATPGWIQKGAGTATTASTRWADYHAMCFFSCMLSWAINNNQVNIRVILKIKAALKRQDMSNKFLGERVGRMLWRVLDELQLWDRGLVRKSLAVILGSV